MIQRLLKNGRIMTKFAFSTQNAESESTQHHVLTRKDNIFTISIIGKPNVGKSTLFNRIMGFQAALVDKTAGLTRDRKELISNF